MKLFVRNALKDAIESAHDCSDWLPEAIERLRQENGDPARIERYELWLAEQTERIVQVREALEADPAPPKGDVAAPPALAHSVYVSNSGRLASVSDRVDLRTDSSLADSTTTLDLRGSEEKSETGRVKLAAAQDHADKAQVVGGKELNAAYLFMHEWLKKVAPKEYAEMRLKAEAPAEPVAQPQESIEAHQPIECRSRYCAQHRDIWRHYEDVIAKAEPVAPPPRNVQAQFDPLYDPNEALALEQSALPPPLNAVIVVGRQMANVCFNLSQPLHSVTDRDRTVMAELYQQWDDALRAFRLVQGEQASPPQEKK